MSRAVGKYMAEIREQRQILDEWSQYRGLLNDYLDSVYNQQQAIWSHIATAQGMTNSVTASTHTHGFSPSGIDQVFQTYHRNLDVAEKRLKQTAAAGSVVDVSATRLAKDISCVIDPRHMGQTSSERHRIRDNLAKMDFYEKFGRITPISVTRLSVQRIERPDANASPQDTYWAFSNPTYTSVVLLRFDDPQDAMLYRLSL